MDEKTDRLSTIKATGWTSTILFGLLTYWIIVQIIMTLIYQHSAGQIIDAVKNDEEMYDGMEKVSNTLTLANVIWTTAFGLCLFGLIGSIGLLKFKNWGRIVFHSATLTVVGLIISVIGYQVWTNEFMHDQQIDDLMPDSFELSRKASIICYGTLLLVIAWLLTRINILLFKKSYRMEFL